MLLALQVKVGKVASFVGKIFVVRASTMKKQRIFCPPEITRYKVRNSQNSAPKCMHGLITYTPDIVTVHSSPDNEDNDEHDE